MLLWQRIEWHKRHTFLSKLFFFSAVMHGALLFVVLFFYKGENFTHVINLDSYDMTVMFLPFQKTVAAQPAPAGAQQGRSGLKVVKTSSKKKKQVVAQLPPATALVAEIKKKKKKEVKNQQPVVAKKEEKVAHQKIEQPQEEPIAVAQTDAQESSDENILYAGQQDLAALALREELRDEIEHAWHPPVGLAAGRSCTVRILIDWQGKAEEIVFEESSHILAFDTSVRHALLTMKFPKSSYGKELILPFH